MDPTGHNIDGVVQSVFDTMVGQAPVQRPGDDPAVAGGLVRATVRLHGAWDGHVRLEVARDLAQDLAAAMLDRDPALVENSQMLDAMGELANMIAGNLKPLIPGTRLTPGPLVTELPNEGPRPAGPGRSYQLDGRAVRVEMVRTPTPA